MLKCLYLAKVNFGRDTSFELGWIYLFYANVDCIHHGINKSWQDSVFQISVFLSLYCYSRPGWHRVVIEIILSDVGLMETVFQNASWYKITALSNFAK